MSALDDVIHFHEDNCTLGSECDLSALSRAELAAMRQRIAEFEAAANAMRSTFDALIGSGDTTAATLKPRQCCAERDALRARVAELEANIIECDAMTNLDRKPRGIDEAEVAIVRMASEGREAIDKLAELEAKHAATLRPRKCDDIDWIVEGIKYMPLDGTETPEQVRRSILAMIYQGDVNALEIMRPRKCDHCNPLAPDGD